MTMGSSERRAGGGGSGAGGGGGGGDGVGATGAGGIGAGSIAAPQRRHQSVPGGLSSRQAGQGKPAGT